MTLRPVLRGTPIQMPAVDSVGFVRRPAPVDGFAFDDDESCGFIPALSVETAVMDLKLLKRRGRR